MTFLWWLILACVCIVVGVLVHEVVRGKKPPYTGEGE